MDTLRIFSRAVVTPDGQRSAEVVIEDGVITAVETASGPSASALDWSGETLIPGLVDIHTDNYEKHYQPRPGALWDAYGAALAHDAQCAAAAITTVFDSLSLHGSKDGLNRRDALPPMIAALDAADADGALRADHLLHLRCEVTNPELLALLEPHVDHPKLKLLSVMDHTPGQRQSTNTSRLQERLVAAGRSEAEIEEMLARRHAGRDPSVAADNRRKVVAFAREFGLPLAAHDDASIEHVEEARDDGCAIAEFPVTLEAARHARGLGMAICMGGPNFVRGASHSGNLSAREAAEADLLDILASDYVPLSMLRSAFMLTDRFGWSPQKAIATVSSGPARACGLTDRGEIACGQRADLVRVSRRGDGWPVPLEVWREGRRVA
ncbi:MAG: alpha-D-ribose 1-methylphosphonate 5-triphosphate diphosphatase [Phenylobacterium sp.]|jgi:alpha-D-ribose 1-methylphosphonate 5-triphosphate diphosphatase|uniref:alpha-D-ribose 1-methylphosphonate 5-triphosphate diphosphatase n=1 Tax=Phenylobacterium sp. TaxID=1871053 RepID=UPI002A36A150|nr:alpha-D-ribose 1-methylphosphonate 5-triphosphate diphosphatase [Phenylobacterium sp.]MDX9998119.1 alpha-D-ribose 1-methylphosphonate 5-triphosphate diphosphatase [Phenylobacterium sp.]